MWDGNRESLWRTVTSRDSILRWAWQSYDVHRAGLRRVITTAHQPVIELASSQAIAEFLRGVAPGSGEATRHAG